MSPRSGSGTPRSSNPSQRICMILHEGDGHERDTPLDFRDGEVGFPPTSGAATHEAHDCGNREGDQGDDKDDLRC